MKIKYSFNIKFVIGVFFLLSAKAGYAQQDTDLSKPVPLAWEADSLFRQQLPIDDMWWNKMEDPLLDSLIAEGISNNHNLLVAMSNIRIAKANLRIQQGNYYPSFSISAGWTKARNSENISKYSTGIDDDSQYASAALMTNWEIDLFGSIRKQVKAQKELYHASVDDYNGVMVSLCAQIATAYAGLRIAQQQYIVAEENLNSQKEILHIVEVRYNTGLSSLLDVSQARGIYYDTQASLPSIELSIKQYINTLAVLLACYPEQISSVLTVTRPLPNYNQYVDIGIPSNLLRQRPDIRAAEKQVSSLAASLGASKADWFPKFFIKGSVGFSSRDMNKFFQKGSLTYQIEPTMTWTIFQGRQIAQATQRARAQLDVSIENFNQTVLTAVQEVDNAMNAYSSSIKQVGLMKKVCIQGQETLRLSFELYKKGLNNFQSVLDAQRSLLSYQNTYVSVQGNALSSLIELYRSLGGGWDTTNVFE